MKKYHLIFCALGVNALSPFASASVAHAEERPRAAQADTTASKETGGSRGAQNNEATKPSPTTEKTNPNAANRVHMGPTTVTVIDDGEAIDDVVSRVRQARIERLRQDEPRKIPRDRIIDRIIDRGPENRPLRERGNKLEKRIEDRRDGKKLNDRAEDRSDKAETRGERRDEGNDKRETRLERFKEKREQRNETDRPVRDGRPPQ